VFELQKADGGGLATTSIYGAAGKMANSSLRSPRIVCRCCVSYQPIARWKKTKAFATYKDAANPQISIENYISEWAGTSANSSLAYALQMAAKKEFKGGRVDLLHGTYAAKAKELMRTDGDFHRHVLRKMYEITQENFKKAGMKHIAIYRGMRWYEGSTGAEAVPGWARPLLENKIKAKAYPISARPMSSFSAAINTAASF
jgi:hypothetical protein